MVFKDDLDTEIVRLVALGHTNGAIATRLHVSRDTVAHRLTTLMARAGVKNRAHLVARLVADRTVTADQLTRFSARRGDR